MLTRREAILISIGAYLGRSNLAISAVSGAFSDRQYADATVIDALGGPGGFDPGEPYDAPLSPKFVADVRASGVTAVNVTVN
jgi:hypothetical protein